MTPAEWGELLRHWRLDRGWTQAALAARLEVTDQAVRAWELGNRRPQRRVRARIRLALPELPPVPPASPRPRSREIGERAYRALELEDAGLPPAEIAEALGVGRPAVVRMLRRAEDLGFERAEPDPGEVERERRDFGRRVVAARDGRGWTQAEMAQWLAVEPGTLRDWELGRRVPRGRGAEAIERDLPEALPLPRRPVRRRRPGRRQPPGRA